MSGRYIDDLSQKILSNAAALANRMYVFLEIRTDQPGATLYDLWYSAETYIHDLEADVVKARAERDEAREQVKKLSAEIARLRDESIRHAECCKKAEKYDKIMKPRWDEYYEQWDTDGDAQ